MKYAILSDIHANLPALEAVLADVDARDDVDAIFHLGDLVGYAPWPDEVVDLLRDRAIAGVADNYDSTVATDYAHCGCRYEDPRQEELAHLSYEWTRRPGSRDAPQPNRGRAPLPAPIPRSRMGSGRQAVSERRFMAAFVRARRLGTASG